MRLLLELPTRLLVDTPVSKVTVEAEGGSFCLLPGHVDVVAALTSGILLYATAEREENLVAVDEGILVKRGEEVRIAVRQAMEGAGLEELQRTVEREFRARDERERTARGILEKLESHILRHLIHAGGWDRPA
jgi:F-type H+-transporting ATPase subunit epsilon